MPDKSKKFHEFALKSILFKGQHDLYFCYIKSEKIAHVLSVLQSRSLTIDAKEMGSLVSGASRLPETIAHFAAGEMELSTVLADLFGLLSAVRLSVSQNFISRQNAELIAMEYESVAERLAGGGRLSPFVTAEDFLLPAIPDTPAIAPPLFIEKPLSDSSLHIKDIKGQYKGQQKDTQVQREVNKRASIILGYVRKHPASSIKDISKVVRDCSEKTIQRELALLIEQGLVEKRGERRWSVYYPL